MVKDIFVRGQISISELSPSLLYSRSHLHDFLKSQSSMSNVSTDSFILDQTSDFRVFKVEDVHQRRVDWL